MLTTLTLLVTALGALASPIPPVSPAPKVAARDLGPYVGEIQIHPSCNVTQTRQIKQALAETREVVILARDYLQEHGHDALAKQYFGDTPRAWPSALGAYQALIEGNKAGVVFRCDDPDGNCALPGYFGHWRGKNATSETVICEASYTARQWNAEFCTGGFQLANDKPTRYWSIDLLHRLFHVPQISYRAVDHFAEDLTEVFDLAEANSTFTPWDSGALQYFAANVYINHIGAGESCLGDLAAVAAQTGAAASKSAAAATAAAASKSAAATTGAAASKSAAPSATAAADCHSHADGSVHCGSHDAPNPTSAPASTVPASSSPPSPVPTSSSSAAAGGADCHSHADGTVHCGAHRRDALPAPAPQPQDDCHYHADGTYHCGSHRRAVHA